MCNIYFYPRSPCGERLAELSDIFKANQISIHALLAESDWADMQSAARKITFLSTLSLRRATIHDRLMGGPAKISIHALLAESDNVTMPAVSALVLFLSTLSLRRATYPLLFWGEQHGDFYPRSPCGERRASNNPQHLPLAISIHALLAESDAIDRVAEIDADAFLSTLSLRRATRHGAYTPAPPGISIHALLAERDSRFPTSQKCRPNFYPRSPCGERPKLNTSRWS